MDARLFIVLAVVAILLKPTSAFAHGEQMIYAAGGVVLFQILLGAAILLPREASLLRRVIFAVCYILSLVAIWTASDIIVWPLLQLVFGEETFSGYAFLLIGPIVIILVLRKMLTRPAT